MQFRAKRSDTSPAVYRSSLEELIPHLSGFFLVKCCVIHSGYGFPGKSIKLIDIVLSPCFVPTTVINDQTAEAAANPALFPAQLRDAAVRGRSGAADRDEDTGPHGLPEYGKHFHAPEFRDDEEIQRGYACSNGTSQSPHTIVKIRIRSGYARFAHIRR